MTFHVYTNRNLAYIIILAIETVQKILWFFGDKEKKDKT